VLIVVLRLIKKRQLTEAQKRRKKIAGMVEAVERFGRRKYPKPTKKPSRRMRHDFEGK
jgi:hypothetical protein